MADLFPDIDVGEMLTPGVVLSFEAAAAITKGQAVYLSDDMKVSPATSAQDCIGIALKSVNAGEQCPVCVRGIVKVEAGGAIARGKAVYAGDSAGRVLELTDQPVDEGGTATYTIYYNRKLGTALQTFSAAGDKGLILVGK